MLADYIKIAFNALRKRKTRSWLTMIGIFIGIAAVVSLIGLGEGLRAAITSQFGFLGHDILSVQASGVQFGPPGSGTVTPLSDDLAKEIEKISGVEVSFNRYIKTTTMEFDDIQKLEYTITMPNGDNRKTVETMANLEAQEGRLLKDSDLKKVVIGNNFANEDNAFKRRILVGDKVILKGTEFEVVGILEKKGSFMFDDSVLINEEPMLEYLRVDDGTTDIIAIKVRDVKLIDNVKEDVEELLRKERSVRKGEEDFTVESPQKTLETLNSTLFAVQLFVYIIASISLLVGGIGIMNTMYTAVVERTKEIGIMKSIGARNRDIFVLFFVESGFLGATGGIIGIIIGVALALGMAYIGGIYFGSDLIQARITFWLIFGALAFSFIVGSIAGITPALRASKLHPVDALRFAK